MVEGATLTLDAGGSADPDGDGLAYSWDVDGDATFGDATGVGPTLSWAELQALGVDDGPATYQISVRITDGTADPVTATIDLVLGNTPPTAVLRVDPTPVDEGDAFTLALVDPADPSGTDTVSGFRYKFDCGSGYGDWGDGSTTTCGTTDSGVLTVHGMIKDKDQDTTEYAATLTVTNLPPTATFHAPAAANEGDAIALSLTGPQDAPGDLGGLAYAFDCGDGAGFGPYGASSTASCPTTDDGARTALGKVRDKDGGVSAYRAEVAIANVVPTASFGSPPAVDANAAFQLSVTGAADPSSADVAAGFAYAFDCGSGYGAFDANDAATCTAGGRGPIVVGGRVRDKDGGTTEYRADVDVTAPQQLAAQVQQPINPDGSSVFAAKRGVVPVKFRLTDDGEQTRDLPPATIVVTRTGGQVIGVVNESVYASAADGGGNFRIGDCQYVYNLDTESLGPGVYLVDIVVGAVVGSATFTLK